MEEIKIVRTEAPGGVAQVYSNSIDVNWTAYDVNMRFNHNQRLPDSQPTNRLEHRATVTVAWPEAKELYRVLGGILARYEAANGEIKPPKVP